MTKLQSNLPTRQKYLLILAVSIGFLIWLCLKMNTFSSETINTFIFIFSFVVPFMILSSSAIMDLNDNKVYFIWMAFSFILLIISVSNNSSQFIIHRSTKFDKSSGINSLISDRSTSSLKSLFFFLIIYWPLNQISKIITGNFIVNTYKQITWTNELAKRKMNWIDVLCNIILFITIIVSVLF